MSTLTKPRLIESLPSIERKEPMGVIVMSPARSGTTSVEKALTHLGFRVYEGMKHGFLYAKRGENTYPQWSEALDAKYPLASQNNTRYGVTEQYTTAEFEKILGNYTAIVGWPASLFPDEMLAAYPTAKIILMSRPTSSWSASMGRALVPRLTWPSWKFLLPLENGLIRDCINCGQRCLNVFTDGEPTNTQLLEKHFDEHNALVKKEVPKERLLVYSAQEGWGPLCEFLGKEVPEKDFPREAEGGKFEKQGVMFWRFAVAKVVVKGVVLGGMLGVGYAAVRWASR